MTQSEMLPSGCKAAGDSWSAELLLLILALLPFAGAVLRAGLSDRSRNLQALAAGGTTALELLVLLSFAPAAMAGDVPSAHFEWVPALGLAASFFIDPLEIGRAHV